MPGKVNIDVIEGKMEGKSFVFDEHDTFIFGRMADCHACLPDDSQVSRHHFMLEVNPPDVRVRDLGSLNGTHLRQGAGAAWQEIGRRKKGEKPEEGAKRKYADVDLKDGDRIQVGRTVIRVRLEQAVACAGCGVEIPEPDRAQCAWPGGTFMCAGCRQKAAETPRAKAKAACPDCGREIGTGNAEWGGRHGDADYCRGCWEVGHGTMRPARERFHREPLRCKNCGKDVEQEVGPVRRGDYVCEACRRKAEENPAELLYVMLRQAGLIAEGKTKPEIPGYEMGDPIGKGGFGCVYLARRKSDGRQVAVKVMLSKVAVNEKARNDFLREMEITRALKQHPNVVTLLDHGTAGTGFYFVMEYYRLGSVADLMKRKGGRIPLAEASPLMLQSLDGLIYMHSESFVHRDLKPDNILLDQQGNTVVAKISDLGLAKNFERAGFSGCTVTGQYAGTYQFMPREQLTNFKYMKPTSDVWSMGATFYNMLTGALPYTFPRGKDPATIVLHEEVVPIRRRDATLPKRLAEAIDKSLARNAGDRYQTAQEMRSAIESAL